MIGILDAGRIAVFLVDPQKKRLVHTNDCARTLLGYSKDELSGMPVSKLCVEKASIINGCLKRMLAERRDHSTSLKLKTSTKKTIAAEGIVSTLHGGANAYILAIMRERIPRPIDRNTPRLALIGERKAGSIKRTRRGHGDSGSNEVRNVGNHNNRQPGGPTGSRSFISNRALLVDRLDQALIHAHWNHRIVAVAFLDLDNFGLINQSLGHDAGDRLLQRLFDELTNTLRDTDTVAHLGGDNFVFILDDVVSNSDVRAIADKIWRITCRSFVIDDCEVFIKCSMGISVYPQDGKDADTLLRKADAALANAKANGRNRLQLYAPGLGRDLAGRLKLETDLQYALERNEFLVFYQPQVDLITGDVVGVEALLRWNHPELGLVLPSTFIHLLEEIDLMAAVGEWVLRTACAQCRRWDAAGLDPLTVSVNVSCSQFKSTQLDQTVIRILRDTGLPPARLQLELTESMLLQTIGKVMDALARLQALGIRLAIDDFGRGYSSFAYLKSLPLHALKLDQLFVQDIAHDARSAAITNSISIMAHNLGLQVIAEGVERPEQISALRACGCDLFQGYIFSKPLLATDIEPLISPRR